MGAKKAVGIPLGTPETLKGTAKLAGAVKWPQEKKYIPTNPFKSA